MISPAKKSTATFFLMITVFLLLCMQSFAQNMEAVIKAQAMEMARAILNKDKQTVARFIHPDIIELAGGLTETLNRMDSASSAAKKFGATIQKILVGHPLQVVQYKKDLQCILPQNTTLQTSMGTIELETTLVGISRDGGKQWYFLDTSFYGEGAIRKALPDLSPDLIFPARKPPKITPKELPAIQ